MKPRPPNVPVLYVEGPDDVSTIAGLLNRHGLDTRQGQQHLYIKPFGSSDELLDAMQDSIRAERNTPCGFVLDIDIALNHRWQAVADRLRFANDPTTQLEAAVDSTCPPDGYIGRVHGYRHPFGVWLMPDCTSDGKKLEDLVASLIPAGDPLKSHATASTDQAARLVDEANAGGQAWERFTGPDTIKAQVRAWLAWQREPGAAFGAAINNRILRHDSPEAMAFLNWLSRLFGFHFPSRPA